MRKGMRVFFNNSYTEHTFKSSTYRKGTSRCIVEEYYRKYLEPNEVVHHLNFNRDDNSILNLAVMTSKEHGKAHSSLRYISRDLFKKGVVVFNKKKNIYELNHKWKLILK